MGIDRLERLRLKKRELQCKFEDAQYNADSKTLYEIMRLQAINSASLALAEKEDAARTIKPFCGEKQSWQDIY